MSAVIVDIEALRRRQRAARRLSFQVAATTARDAEERIGRYAAAERRARRLGALIVALALAVAVTFGGMALAQVLSWWL